MPLSIFNSSRLNSTRAIVLLVAALFLYVCALETIVWVGMKWFSHDVRRIDEDYRAAAELGPTTPEGAQTVLIVGNSLLMAAVDKDKLQKEMLPTYFVRSFGIENTGYLDWYFGLRRFFAEGFRPAIVILCLPPRHIIMNLTRGEEFAHTMLQMEDILSIKKIAGLDMTTTSNYFFAHISHWLGYRSRIHNRLLAGIFPGFEMLSSYLSGNSSPMPPNEIMLERAIPRLKELQELCRVNGARFFFLIPPLTSTKHPARELQAAAARADITVILPYQPGEMPVSNFKDGFHVNPQGAALFTERLQPALLQAFSQNDQQRGNNIASSHTE